MFLSDLRNDLKYVEEKEIEAWEELEKAAANLPLCEEAWEEDDDTSTWLFQVHVLQDYHILMNDMVAAEEKKYAELVAKYGRPIAGIIETASSIRTFICKLFHRPSDLDN